MSLIHGWAFPTPCRASSIPPVLLKYLRPLHIHQHLTLHCSLTFIGDFLYVRHCHDHCTYPSVNSFPHPFKVELISQGHVARLVDCRPMRSESGARYSPASKSTPLPHLELCCKGGSCSFSPRNLCSPWFICSFPQQIGIVSSYVPNFSPQERSSL